MTEGFGFSRPLTKVAGQAFRGNPPTLLEPCPRPIRRGGMRRIMASLSLPAALWAIAVPAAAQQARDSTIVVDVQRTLDSAVTLVTGAFAEGRVEIAVASPEQGLVLSAPVKIGRPGQEIWGLYRAELESLGPITRVVLSGTVSPSPDLERKVAVRAGSFFNGALIWARLQEVARTLRRVDES